MLRNATEIEIFKLQIKKSNRLSLVILGLTMVVLSMYILLILVPTLLQSKYQIHYLAFIGYFYNERSRLCDFVSIQILISGAMGILAIASTEATMGVYGFYLSALFQIVSYRIRTSIDEAAMLVTLSSIDVSPAVRMHQRAIKHAESVGTEMMFSALSAILVAVLSFATNLYRAFLAFTDPTSTFELVFCSLLVIGHVIIMFVDNYTGQALIDNSVVVFAETCHIVE
ncbi:uncharacterized protein LOC144477939 isoform X2 [Augochlora pura]